MTRNKKRTLVLLLAIAGVLSILLSGCGKSAAVKAAEEAIKAIGEITFDSGDAIANAEKLYNLLTDNEKEKVSNRLELIEAKDKFEKLQSEVVYNNAKTAYEKLNDVAKLCIDGMDDIYGAWYWGIYKADDIKDYSTVYSSLAKETPHFTETKLEEAANTAILGYSSDLVARLLTADWQYCLYVVEEALKIRGDYDTIEKDINEASTILQELTKTYDDFTYYPKLKDYYSAVSSYVEFFKSPSGSFKQLSDTINNYETNIRTYQSDVGFLFNK